MDFEFTSRPSTNSKPVWAADGNEPQTPRKRELHPQQWLGVLVSLRWSMALAAGGLRKFWLLRESILKTSADDKVLYESV